MENSVGLRNESDYIDIPPGDSGTIYRLNTVRDVLGPNWREFFCNDSTIARLLFTVCAPYYQYEGIETKYAISGDRLSLVLKVTDIGKSYLKRMIIDVVLGEPTWQQMMDVTFKIGDGCNPKIVVYGSSSDSDECLDLWIAGFAHMNNACGLTTHLVAMKPLLRGVSFVPQRELAFDEETGVQNTPSKEEVERTELILHLDPDFYPEVWPCSYLADRLDDIEVHFPIWEHSGLFMEFRSLSGKGQKQLRWVLENKKDWIREKISFVVDQDHGSVDKSKIRVKVWDKPFTEFLYASEEEKWKCGATVLDSMEKRISLFEELLKDCSIV
jgi:hypothetical protein